MGTHGNQMKTTLTRLLLSTPVRLLLAGLICSSPFTTQAKDGQTAASMAKAATELLASLDADLRSSTAYAFEDKTRDV